MTGNRVQEIWLFRFLCARGFFRKFEADFLLFQFQIRGERPATFRDEALKKIGLSRAEEFLRLFLWNFAAKDRSAEFEFAWLSIGL